MTNLAELTDAELIAEIAAALDDEPELVHALAVMCSTFDLRALTVRYPWCALLAAGLKDVENRTFKTKYRGPILIHSSAGGGDLRRLPAFARLALTRVATRLLARGHILALANITDCHPHAPGCCESPWAERADGVWHWQISGVRALPMPIPAKGRLGLWRPDRDLLVRSLRQLREASDVD